MVLGLKQFTLRSELCSSTKAEQPSWTETTGAGWPGVAGLLVFTSTTISRITTAGKLWVGIAVGLLFCNGSHPNEIHLTLNLKYDPFFSFTQRMATLTT
jgi:hypothetical protein